MCEAHRAGTSMEKNTHRKKPNKTYSFHPGKSISLAFQKLYDSSNLKFSTRKRAESAKGHLSNISEVSK